MSVDDYISFSQGNFGIREENRETATNYLQRLHIAEAQGFASVDEYINFNQMEHWSPENSSIMQAHQHGFTMDTFNRYMTDVQQGRFHDTSLHHLPEATVAQNQADFARFRRDLIFAGYLGTGFSYELDGNDLTHGVWQFAGHTSDQSIEQVHQLEYLQQQLGRDGLNELLDSFENEKHSGDGHNYDIRSFIRQAVSDLDRHEGTFGMQKRPVGNDNENNNVNDNVNNNENVNDNSNDLVSANEFWEAYGLIN